MYAPQAESVTLCLFDADGHERRIPIAEQTMGAWHCRVPDLPPGTAYGFRADGPWDPANGLCFDPDKLLLDPYARAISGEVTDYPATLGRNGIDSAPAVPRSHVVAPDDFDWADDRSLKHRWSQTVIYELHVKGFTQTHDRIPKHLRGTYLGLAHPVSIAYLKGLGVTAVELLPIQAFLSEPAVAARGMTNYWGYNTISYFAPHPGYSATGDPIREVKEMVKALHAADIAVILDVVYNHTAEGDLDGPVLSLRGLDDGGFYLRTTPPPEPDDTDSAPGYRDVTGCGNTVDASYPAALRLILDSLRHWATEFHIDGFRFDLASALARSEGDPDVNRSAFVTAIAQDPVLRDTKLIAEPWDASPEGYQVGRFPAPFCEWNDRYRDTVRDFWRGRASVAELAYRLAGSSDLYADETRPPYASINFVTAHDGFTLRDLVSYNAKHNEANGEENRDGTDDNRSWNCGVEGETDDAEIVALRHRQAANLMATLLLSTGIPMLTAGDERGRTQRGNNNPYVQDNEISWLDWAPDDAWLDLYDVTHTLLGLRRAHPALRQRHFFDGRPAVRGGPKDLAWINPAGREMDDDDWADEDLQTIGMFVSGEPLRAAGPRGEVQVDNSFLTWFHAGADAIRITLPDNPWVERGEVVFSTDPAYTAGTAVHAGEDLILEARSVLVLRSL